MEAAEIHRQPTRSPGFALFFLAQRAFIEGVTLTGTKR
jgi:ABC-type maltose transport system permease subunit